MPKAFLGLGSNIDPDINMRKALELLGSHAEITGISTVYLTPAEERPEQPSYYNCVVEVETDMPPVEFRLSVLKKIENALGRKRTEDKFASRTIDLDLILYNDMVVADEDLTLPDPQILRRAFVAIPLNELSPALRLPGSGLYVADIAASMSGSGMKPLKDYTDNLRKEIRCRERNKG